MKKSLLFLLLVGTSIFSFSQNNIVQVIASGDGDTKDKAVSAALRHCIEKTFGVFISANSKIVNDSLVTDEIASIASGNIISYEVVSELENAGNVNVVVSALVSPENVVKVFKGKGYEFEINGGVYVQNILKEEFYKKQELEIINNFINTWRNIQLFDFDIQVGEPSKISPDDYVDNYNHRYEYGPLSDKSYAGTSIKDSIKFDKVDLHNDEDDIRQIEYQIPVTFTPRPNKNLIEFKNALIKIIKNISIKGDIEDYKKLSGEVYTLTVIDSNSHQIYYLRNIYISYLLYKLGGHIFVKSTALDFYETENEFINKSPIFISGGHNVIVFPSAFYNTSGVDAFIYYCYEGRKPVDANYVMMRYDPHTFDFTGSYQKSLRLFPITFDELKKINKLEFRQYTILPPLHLRLLEMLKKG
jgi:hypothetical protein